MPHTTWACYLLAISCSLIAVAGIYWSLFHDRARGRIRCPKCWYDAQGTLAGRCPECGLLWPSEKTLRRTRRHRWRVVPFVLIALYATAAAITPDIRDHGWPHRLPTRILVWLYPWADRPLPVRGQPPLTHELWLRLYDSPDSFSTGIREDLARRCAMVIDLSEDPAEVKRSLYLLMEVGQPAMASLSSAWRVLDASTDPWIKLAAVQCLLRIDPANPRVMNLVHDEIRSHADDSAVGIINCIPVKGDPATLYIDILAHTVTHGTEAAPLHAAMKLASIGPRAIDALPAVNAANARAENNYQHFYFRLACQCINAEFESPTHFYAAMLSDPIPATRTQAAIELTQNRDRSLLGIPEIVHALESPRPNDEPDMRINLIDALAQRTTASRNCLPLLQRIADDANERLEVSAAAKRAIEIIEYY